MLPPDPQNNLPVLPQVGPNYSSPGGALLASPLSVFLASHFRKRFTFYKK